MVQRMTLSRSDFSGGRLPSGVRRLSRARDRLFADLDLKQPLGELARGAALSPGQRIRAFGLGTFSHVFAKRIGVAPTAFRRQARALVRVSETPTLKLYPGCLVHG